MDKLTYGRAVAMAFALFMHVVLRGSCIFLNRGRKSDFWHFIVFESHPHTFRFFGTPAQYQHMLKRADFFNMMRRSQQ